MLLVVLLNVEANRSSMLCWSWAAEVRSFDDVDGAAAGVIVGGTGDRN